MAYSYITLAQARGELLTRLNSTGADFWTVPELNAYISESLQFWNCLTQWFIQDYVVTWTLGGGGFGQGGFGNGGFGGIAAGWATANSPGSPREQTYTEADLYSIVLYHLLEPQLSGTTWTGTAQFDLASLQASTQNVLNEIMQKTACNMGVSTSLSIPTNSNRVTLPDTILDVRRVRYVGSDGTNATLTRGDSLSFMRFSPGYRQTSGTPARWDVLGSPPLTLTFDKNANQPNTLELLTVNAANTLDPAHPQLLLVPNDWLWVLKYGVLADMLSNAPEASDPDRFYYCQKRYEQGLQLMMQMPWILNAFVNEVPVDTPPVIGKDRYSYEWQSKPTTWPGVVVGGIDLFSLAPIPTATTGVRLTVVGNAPQPTSDGDFIQASRDVVDVLLDYAQHVAVWKCGGYDLTKTVPLLQNLVQYAQETNSRLRESGIFATDLRPPVSKQDLENPRVAQSQ